MTDLSLPKLPEITSALAGDKVMLSDTVRTRTSRDAENTKRDILLAAMHEFSEYGDSGARMDRIARRAKANKSLIYAYFGNKEALYAEVLREAYAQIRAGECKLNLDHLEPKEAIGQLIRFTMEHYLRSPWFLRLLATENLRRGETVSKMQDIAALQSPLINQLSRVLARGEASGIFRRRVDATDLYILVASFFYFPISNVHTLSSVFKKGTRDPDWLESRRKMAEEMVVSYLQN